MKSPKRYRDAAMSVQTRPKESFSLPMGAGEHELYRSLREAVPIIDASIDKIRRLLGSFEVKCEDIHAEADLKKFLSNVRVNSCGIGIDDFIGTYFEELLTYGNALGEMVLSGGEIAALYNAALENVEIEETQTLETRIYLLDAAQRRECKYPQLLLLSKLNAEAGSAKGKSVLRGLPFVSEILLKIYKTIGVNWDRMGNVRFAVTCKPDGSGGAWAGERAKQMATEWKHAMHSPEVSDFVAVGDVSIKAIGADNQILESNVPVRQMLEQIVAKMGVPPFLLGLSWSSTERMSSQQADVLTSELEAYRRVLTPVVRKICSMWLVLNGYNPDCEVEWSEITMQDEVEHANARYLTAKAREIEMRIAGKEH